MSSLCWGGLLVGEGRHIPSHGFLQSCVTPKLEQKGVDLEPEKRSWFCLHLMYVCVSETIEYLNISQHLHEIKKQNCKDDAVSVAVLSKLHFACWSLPHPCSSAGVHGWDARAMVSC
ncbi:unnamed protein product [Rangifer tarandus platyrhynchus]|uniref:Uncharacterized protein n=1 Tax=Rangifer tarandus platyrhynchus TaxID=3082113 RepID=A0AC59ZMW8_RANTA